MSASIVRRHHFEIERVIAAVDVVLDARVRELHVTPFVAREVVFASPVPNLVKLPIWPAITVVAIAIPFLEELLIFAFQVVLQDHAMDVCAFVPQSFGLLQIGAIELRIVLQLSRFLDAVMERLPLA
jgi:hypothetical protein